MLPVDERHEPRSEARGRRQRRGARAGHRPARPRAAQRLREHVQPELDAPRGLLHEVRQPGEEARNDAQRLRTRADRRVVDAARVAPPAHEGDGQRAVPREEHARACDALGDAQRRRQRRLRERAALEQQRRHDEDGSVHGHRLALCKQNKYQ